MITLTEKKKRFKNYIKQFYRDYQVNAFKQSFDNKIGQFLFPTGTGKTYIQQYIHAREAILKENSNKFATCVIVAHRLLLCLQLLKKLMKFFKRIGLEYEIIFVGSGGQNDIVGMLDADLIGKKVNEIKNNKKHVIIASTYHSICKLEMLDKIDVCTFDEAHNIVLDDPKREGQFKKDIGIIKPIINKEFYFTATPKSFVDMNGKVDETFFGDVLGWMSPREAIDRRFIVEPALLIGETFRENKEVDPNDKNVIVQSIIENFEYQLVHSNLAPKVLISFKNIQRDLVPVYDDKRLKQWCDQNNIIRLMFSSTKTGNRINDKTYKHISNEMVEELEGIKENPEAKCLFMHYDVLSEGIDIPNMTGILLFRDLEKHELKFIQNIGRCCRTQEKKEYAYVSIPDYLLEEEKYKDIITQLYTSYDFRDFTDIKVFVGSTKDGGGGRSVKRYRSDDIDDLEIKHKLIRFDFDIAKKDLNTDFENSSDKEKFLMDLIEEAYPEEDIIELVDVVKAEPDVDLMEAALKEISTNVHERNPEARRLCLEEYGYTCAVCEKDLESIYGIQAIHVHHLTMLADAKKEREVDPIKDLRPVCPNCHMIIHTRRIPGCYSIKEVKEMIKK
jgi:superfamily II DNA or RNA helicase